MPRVLCIIGLILSGLVALLFLLDLILSMAGMSAPFGGHSLLMDVVFLISALTVAVLTFFTLRETV